jgi:16S rRNA (guanine(527)-N(7))-methyltransferase RsmG
MERRVVDPDDEEPRIARLRGAASELMGTLAADEARQLDAFCRLFATWNVRINLGGARSFDELVDEHLVDAFAARGLIVPGDFVVDVGSGGGLPAIPLACLCRDASFELWEPRTKRAAFLRTAVRELELRDRVSIVGRRLEVASRGGEPPVSAAGAARRYSVAMSRATWAPPEWLVRARQVAPGARVLVFATATSLIGLEPPSQVVPYGPHRRLAVFLPRV